MNDFNTVAVFSTLDPLNYGYLDFGNIKDFLSKYEKEIMKENILAIIRRLSDQPDSKISFREFSLGLTPEVGCLDQEAVNLEFNSDLKTKMEKDKKSFNQPLETSSNPLN